MALSVKHLNADTTFLLTLSQPVSPLDRRPQAHHSRSTILVDPWLAGASTIWTPRFQISHHVEEPILFSLADIPLPDIILISQAKPDHCHEETLRTLPTDSQVTILAVPDAAKKIRSWKHFTRASIITLAPWDPKSPEAVHRIPIPSRDLLFGTPGELTICNIPQKYDMTNLHNAIGITYVPPDSASSDKTGQPQPTLPISPPLTPAASRANSPTTPRPPDFHFDALPQAMAKASTSQFTRPLSILYSPHGIGIPCITPFMTHHLAPLKALPLTALFHSINIEQNPWFLGGRVATGYPGGSALVRRFGAAHWISAHDEAKDNRGWSVAMLKSRAYTPEEAQVLLDDDLDRDAAAHGASGVGRTNVVALDVGEELLVRM